ncbi:MAG TPA: saccharopine dehydrogenase C-terminal domain-containing protein [Flavitalea sp.]|nr:saccharopine dehydrogenase C-terminal domain-containing protein [Flavitalea sp.]
MKHIVLFGAGKSATALIQYLVMTSEQEHWRLTVADSDAALVRSKTGNSKVAAVASFDVAIGNDRAALIKSADIVISLLPPSLHYLVATDCLAFSKNLLTASYIDEKIRSLSTAIKEKQLLFLCEMGLDPGIDHMSAMKLIDSIRGHGGKIFSFHSHCGGLVAPESDDNPWRYKVSWNPRNIVLAGKAGANFLENGESKHISYEELFDESRRVSIPTLGELSWYPNRDSVSYMPVYGLDDAETFIRTTLRYPDFSFGWKNILDLKLTDETVQYDTNDMSLQQFFQMHFHQYGFSEWIEKRLTSRFTQTKELLDKLQELLEAEEEAVQAAGDRESQEIMMVDDKGELKDLNLDDVKQNAAATVAGTMLEANLAIKQLIFLGINDDETKINKGLCSAADILQFALEKKLALKDTDHDMVVMLHEVGYTLAGKKKIARSFLIDTGIDAVNTAMSKTVGLPLGIAAKLILQNKIKVDGLCIPTLKEIYEPVLRELGEQGIRFEERDESV